MAVQKPGLTHSTMTGHFYYVSKYKANGAAASKVDVTEQVENIVSHARGPLEDAIQEAFVLLGKCNEASSADLHELLHNIDFELRRAVEVDWKNPA